MLTNWAMEKCQGICCYKRTPTFFSLDHITLMNGLCPDIRHCVNVLILSRMIDSCFSRNQFYQRIMTVVIRYGRK